MSILSKQKFDHIKAFFRRLWVKKWFRFGILPLLLIVLLVVILKGGKGSASTIQTVQLRTLEKTVETTGTVTSTTDLSLSFNQEGLVGTIPVWVGEKVKKGAILARLSAAKANAEVTEAYGALLKAQAEYDRGASSGEGINLSALELENTKTEQMILVANAYRTLLSSDLEAVPLDSKIDEVAPTISGSYTCTQEGEYLIEPYPSNAASGASFNVSGLETGSGSIETVSSEAIGNCGLEITFPENFTTRTDWVIKIPNTKGASYIANQNAYLLAKETEEKVVSELGANLASDTQIDYANLVSAKGAYQKASAALEETIIRAPTLGTITKIDTKLGEHIQPFETAVVLQDVDHLYLETNINESNILAILGGQPVTVTLDASGPGDVFHGTVADVDIAPTLVAGVVNYKVTVLLDSDDSRIRPGMTANMTIIALHAENVLAVPLRSITENDGVSYVSVARDDEGRKTEVRKVVLGSTYDGALVEVVSGLYAGERIVVSQE